MYRYALKILLATATAANPLADRPQDTAPDQVLRLQVLLDRAGIHGTPEPASVGKTNSHGCIRLTNWDASELADMVSPGLPARLVR